MGDQELNLSFPKTVMKLFQATANVVGEIVDLAVLELRLAKKSLGLIIGLYVFMGLLLISGWFTLLAFVAVWLIPWVSLKWSLLIVSGANLFLIIPLFIAALRLKRNLTLPATRQQISSIRGTYENPLNETAEEKDSAV